MATTLKAPLPNQARKRQGVAVRTVSATRPIAKSARKESGARPHTGAKGQCCPQCGCHSSERREIPAKGPCPRGCNARQFVLGAG